MCTRNNAHIYVARTSNNRVISSGDLYCCLLQQWEALRTCRSCFPIRTILSSQKLPTDQIPTYAAWTCVSALAISVWGATAGTNPKPEPPRALWKQTLLIHHYRYFEILCFLGLCGYETTKIRFYERHTNIALLCHTNIVISSQAVLRPLSQLRHEDSW